MEKAKKAAKGARRAGTVKLQESAVRLQMAECAARGHYWYNGACHTKPNPKGKYQ